MAADHTITSAIHVSPLSAPVIVHTFDSPDMDSQIHVSSLSAIVHTFDSPDMDSQIHVSSLSAPVIVHTFDKPVIDSQIYVKLGGGGTTARPSSGILYPISV